MTTLTTAGRRAALVDQLTTEGYLPDPAWRAAWLDTPREEFVPYFFEPHRDRPGWRLVDGGTEWLDGVYSTEALVTQIDGDDRNVGIARREQAAIGLPTSSSSAPPLMAAMLDALDVTDGHRVLEAATGTGYNAALLAHRLGDDQVTSIEIDPHVAGRAIDALHRVGRHPHVRVGDAALGAAERAPFDRIIATVALPHVPAPWLAQSRPGARLVVPLVLAGHGGVMVGLERSADGGAHGRVMSQYGGFMATRAFSMPGAPRIRPGLLDDTRATDVPVAVLGGSHPASFFVSLLTPPFHTIGFTPDGSTTRQTWGRDLGGSTFAVLDLDGGNQVAADGPLWEGIETAYRYWLDHGRPERDRIGVTVGGNGEHSLWLDTPDHLLRRWSPDPGPS